VSQNSLEILRPSYVFEGLFAAASHPWARLSSWYAIPQMEKSRVRYRKILYGGAMDLGKISGRYPVLELPSPLGLRLGGLRLEDDRNSLPAPGLPVDEDERGWLALATLGPWRGFAADGEQVLWERDLHYRAPLTATGQRGRGVRAGLRAERSSRPVALWGQIYRLRTTRRFNPYYSALTIEPNREGYRGAAGLKLFASSDSRERAGITLFYRRVRQTELVPEESDLGRIRSTVGSVTFYGRPWRDLLGELHLVRTENRYGAPVDSTAKRANERVSGLSLDLRWDRWPSFDPMLRVDGLRRLEGAIEPRTAWQAMLSVRVLL
jgi:hypothetical protein